MSVDDLFSAIRALPQADKLRLLHKLIDDVARPDLPPDDVVQRALVLDFAHNPPPEFLEAMYQMLEDHKNGKITG